MTCNKCGVRLSGEESLFCNCGNQINVDLNDGRKRFRLRFSRKKQKFPLLTSFFYIKPRLLINDEPACTFTKCEYIDFYFEKGVYRIDIVTSYRSDGAHLFVEIKEDTKIEFFFTIGLGTSTKITFT